MLVFSETDSALTMGKQLASAQGIAATRHTFDRIPKRVRFAASVVARDADGRGSQPSLSQPFGLYPCDPGQPLVAPVDVRLEAVDARPTQARRVRDRP